MATKKEQGEASDEDQRSALVNLRELLTRSLMLPSDRLRETLDDAVRRGRITRDDAEELVDRLMAVGRAQTDDLLARIEGVVAPSRGARERARSAVRRPPGTDRVLREVDRARRAAGIGNAFPIRDYEELTASQVIARLQELPPADLRRVRDHEKRNANRKMVLTAIDKKLR